MAGADSWERRMGSPVDSVGRRSLARLRQGTGLIVLGVVVAAATALVASALQTPLYSATARVVVGPNPDVPGAGPQVSARGMAETEIQVLLSPAVRALVGQRLGRSPRVSASPVGQAAAFDVTARSTRAARAAAVADAYATAYVEVRLRQAVDALAGGAGSIDARVATLQRQLDALPASDPARASLSAQIGLLRSSRDRLEVASAALAGGTQVVRPAAVPSRPSSPRTVRNGAWAAVAGLGLGVAAALVPRGGDDGSLTSQDDLDDAVPGVVVLGVVPAGPSREGLPVLADAGSAAGQAYRLVGSSLRFRSLDRPLQLVAVTSAAGGEGATTVAANLALAMARAGQRVVLVSCDPARPPRPSPLGTPEGVGLTSVVNGDAPISTALREVAQQAGLQAMSAGPPPADPDELLSSPRLAEVFRALRGQADVVVVDCPPVPFIGDDSVLATSVDGTVLVVSTWASTRRSVRQAAARLGRFGAPLVGVVLVTDRRGEVAVGGEALDADASAPLAAPESGSGS